MIEIDWILSDKQKDRKREREIGRSRDIEKGWREIKSDTFIKRGGKEVGKRGWREERKILLDRV
jgi:hypothetical protein